MPQDEKIPAPEPSPGASQQAYEQLAKKVAELESALSERVLTLEENERQMRLNEISQRISIRFWVVILAALTIVGMAAIIFWAKWTASLWSLMMIPKAYSIAVIISPILSITTVTVALLIGAFRRFKDDDPERVAGSSPATAALGYLTGQR